ncbi:TonB-dependent receptor [Opitutaceae bacterium EW11]|nr:TonB-dependent receptor [Opitutaceae bacterium EW11]
MQSTKHLHPGARRIAGLAILIAARLASVASAESADAAAPADEAPLLLAPVVAVGSRFSERTVTDSPVPIDVLTGPEVRQSGFTELGQVLQAQVPSFSFPRPTLADGTDHVRPAALRGLSPDQTLVLINGKRRHTSALVNLNGSIGRGSQAVDLNAIPTFALGGIEILRDGAAAQYGSDAIAGVINLRLRRDTGVSVTSTVGSTYKGDGDAFETAVNAGASLGGSGFINTTVEYRHRGSTDRSGDDLRQQYFGTNPTTGAKTALASSGKAGDVNGTPDPREAGFNRHDSQQGDPKTDDYGFFLNAEHPLGADLGWYAFGGYNSREGVSAANWRRSGDNATVRGIFPDGYLPKIATKVRDLSFSTGVDGRLVEWKWTLSETYGRNDLKYWTRDSLNVTYGAASPTEFYDGKLAFAQATTNFDASRSFDFGLHAPLNLALGAEYRWENYQIAAGDPASWNDGGRKVLDGPNTGAQPALGAQGFPGFRPTDATDKSRGNYAGYVDVELQITDRWLVSAAVRAERVEDSGSTLTGKLATRFDLTRGFALRGSYNTGFRAPSLGQAFFATTSTVFISGVPYEVRTFQVTDPAARTLGATDLSPEKSRNFSVGLTSAPLPGLTASVDLYRIEVDDRILLSSNFTGANVQQYLASQGFPGISGGRYFTNAADTSTKGLDANLRYEKKFAAGDRLTLTGGFNYNQNRITRLKATPANVAALTGGVPIFDRQQILRFEEGSPHHTLTLGATYDLGRRFSFVVRETRYGQVLNAGSTAASDHWLRSKWLTDVSASYRVTADLSVTLGANNVFDVYPDENNAPNNLSGVNRYSNFSPFGSNGGFYYARFDAKF